MTDAKPLKPRIYAYIGGGIGLFLGLVLSPFMLALSVPVAFMFTGGDSGNGAPMQTVETGIMVMIAAIIALLCAMGAFIGNRIGKRGVTSLPPILPKAAIE